MRGKSMICAVFVLVFFACNTDRGGVASFNGRTTIHMPFETGTSWLCTQGTNDPYSHQSSSTRYDLDFDTPNAPQEMPVLYAPVDGTVYTHFGSGGFGNHVNIDIGDGTYVVLGHMSTVYNLDGASVRAGDAVGLAGNTGRSSGEHVHIGVHLGSAGENAVHGTSIPSNVFNRDISSGLYGPVLPRNGSDHICGISGGHRYTSQLPQRSSTRNDGESDHPYGNGFVELCWNPSGLDNVRAGELWIQDNDWETVDSSSGPFLELCGAVRGSSGGRIVVNGEYEATNTPVSPWWICAHINAGRSMVYGDFSINGESVRASVQNWSNGCDVRITIP